MMRPDLQRNIRKIESLSAGAAVQDRGKARNDEWIAWKDNQDIMTLAR